jgi:excisionase family DNA binding protein
MNEKPDAKRLAEALANVATTIIEIIDRKVRQLAESAKASEPLREGVTMLTPAEGWVDKKAAAEHLQISLSTLRNWMRKGLIPYVRIGRSVRFMLSAVDEAMKRRLGGKAPN